MNPIISEESYNQLIQGDCIEVLRRLPDNSIDALVTKRSQSHATQQSYDTYDKDIQHYQYSLHHLVSQMSLRALCDEHQELYEVASSLYRSVYKCSYPSILLHVLTLSSRDHSILGILHARMDYLRLFDKHCSNQVSKKHNQFYFCVPMQTLQKFFGNFGKSIKRFYPAFSFDLDYSWRLSLRPYLQVCRCMVSLQLSLSRQLNDPHSDIHESKKYRVEPSLFQKDSAKYPFHMRRIYNKFFYALRVSFLLPVLFGECKNIHGYT